VDKLFTYDDHLSETTMITCSLSLWSSVRLWLIMLSLLWWSLFRCPL